MTNAEREQLRELARQTYHSVADVEFVLATMPALLTALDSAEKREKELELESVNISRLYYKENAYAAEQFQRAEAAESALSTERERVIEECAKVVDAYAAAQSEVLGDTGFSQQNRMTALDRKQICRHLAAAVRALRSPEVAPKEKERQMMCVECGRRGDASTFTLNYGNCSPLCKNPHGCSVAPKERK